MPTKKISKKTTDSSKKIGLQPKRYWFLRKSYGWGWYPATWEGWLSLAIFLVVQAWNVLRFQSSVLSENYIVGQILIVTISSTSLLLWLCLKTGEKPRWQWGEPKTK